MIQSLPPFVLAELYKDAIVLTSDVEISSQKELVQDTIKTATPVAENAIQDGKRWYLGENKKNICIIVNDSEAVFINDDCLNLLGGILNACKLNLSDAAIINYNQTPCTYETVKEHLQPKQLFMFDVSMQQMQLPFTIPNYQVQQFDNCTFLVAPSLTTMLPNTNEAKLEKRFLWDSLKRVFGI